MTTNIVTDEQLGVLARRQHDLSGRFIDCDAQPFVPDGWSVEEHRKGGLLEFDPAKIELYLDRRQKSGKIVGHYFRQKLVDKPVLNACVLDHLLANTALIPGDWKRDEQGRTRYIYFWGTVYRDSIAYQRVRYLCWSGGRWQWRSGELDRGWHDRGPAAILAS